MQSPVIKSLGVRENERPKANEVNAILLAKDPYGDDDGV